MSVETLDEMPLGVLDLGEVVQHDGPAHSFFRSQLRVAETLVVGGRLAGDRVEQVEPADWLKGGEEIAEHEADEGLGTVAGAFGALSLPTQVHRVLDGSRDADEQKHGRGHGDGTVPPNGPSDSVDHSKAMGGHRLSSQPPTEIVGESASRRIASLGLLFETCHDHGLDVPGHGGGAFPQRYRILFEEVDEDGDVAIAVKRFRAAEEFVEDDAEREDIGAAIDGGDVAARLFGGEIARRSHDLTGDGQTGKFFNPGDTEVENVWVCLAVVIGDQNIGGFQIAVNEARRVSGLHRFGHLLDQQDLLLKREPRSPRRRGVRHRHIPWRCTTGRLLPRPRTPCTSSAWSTRAWARASRNSRSTSTGSSWRRYLSATGAGDRVPCLEDLAHAAGTDGNRGFVLHRARPPRGLS